MSETKHTTEPWALQRDGNNQPEYIYSTETNQWICQMNRLSQHCILTTEELCRRETNADFIVRARNSHYLLLEALRQITEGEIKCPCCEGNGQLWADGKAHYPSETRDTILCGNCGGSGRLQPTNAQDIARAAIAEAERNQLLEINKKLMDACKAALTCFREVDRLTWARDIVKQIEAVIGGPKNKGDISGA